MTAQAASARDRAASRFRVLRAAFIIALSSVSLAGAFYGAQRFEQFLIRDPRFALPGPADYGEESPNLFIDGVRYASRPAISRIFTQDFGRSVYLLPLDARRSALLRLAWVRDASVRRIWPNRVEVTVFERRPAAFIEVPFGPMSRYALIDADGVILDPPSKARFNLPVLRGLKSTDSQALRGVRVRRMSRLLHDVGPLASAVSEVDAGDLDNLKVRLTMKDQAFLLILGDTNFAARLQNFYSHYAEVHNKVPWATTLDLRLEDRITAVGEAPSGH